MPGLLTGAAARKADPPQSPGTRWSQLNSASQHAASAARSQSATSVTAAGAINPQLVGFGTEPLHGYWGIFPSQTVYGAEAEQSLNPNLLVTDHNPNSAYPTDLLYMPTLDPSALTCIEVSTIYGGGNSQPEIGAWDWCAANPGFAVVVPITSSFLSTYTTTISGHPYYTILDRQTDPATNQWKAYLWNYSTQSWQAIYTSANTSKLSQSGGGWDMDEDYTYYNSSTGEGDYCNQSYGAVWQVAGLEYQFSPGGSWVTADTTNSAPNIAFARGTDLGCDTNSFTLSSDSAFGVGNSTHGAMELIGTASGKCIDTGGVYTNGTPVKIKTCTAAGSQEWTYNADGEFTADGKNVCLTAASDGTADGTPIQVSACTQAQGQEWTFGIHNTLIGMQSDKCLDVDGSGTADQTRLQLLTCSGTDTSQKWT